MEGLQAMDRSGGQRNDKIARPSFCLPYVWIAYDRTMKHFLVILVLTGSAQASFMEPIPFEEFSQGTITIPEIDGPIHLVSGLDDWGNGGSIKFQLEGITIAAYGFSADGARAVEMPPPGTYDYIIESDYPGRLAFVDGERGSFKSYYGTHEFAVDGNYAAQIPVLDQTPAICISGGPLQLEITDFDFKTVKDVAIEESIIWQLDGGHAPRENNLDFLVFFMETDEPRTITIEIQDDTCAAEPATNSPNQESPAPIWIALLALALFARRK